MFFRYSKSIAWLIRLGSLVEYETKNLLISNGKKASISGASGAITRQSSTTTRPKEKLHAKYEKFQKDDGVPIYLKGGLPDRLLFGFTLVLVAIGTVDAIGSLIQMAFKKK